MAILDTLTLEQQAKQLRKPEGPIGLAVADWLSKNNKLGNDTVIAGLNIQKGNRVLEIGFGNGSAAFSVIAAASEVEYTGIDFSATMVGAALRLHGALVSEGRARFELAAAESIPFPNESFDRVFSIGVVHFWPDPLVPLREVRRVLSRKGSLLMGCLAPSRAPVFARSEYGFHLRDIAAWEKLCGEAGFETVDVKLTENEQINTAGHQVKRHTMLIACRRT